MIPAYFHLGINRNDHEEKTSYTVKTLRLDKVHIIFGISQEKEKYLIMMPQTTLSLF